MNSHQPILLPDYTRVYEHSSGGCVDIHPTHGKQELKQNLIIATLLADRGEHVCLLPVSYLPGIKSPDATRNGLAWEFKVPVSHSANAIDRALRDGSRQATRILLQLPADFNLPVLEQALLNRLARATTVLEVAILLSSNLFHFDRSEIINNTFRGKMQIKN